MAKAATTRRKQPATQPKPQRSITKPQSTSNINPAIENAVATAAKASGSAVVKITNRATTSAIDKIGLASTQVIKPVVENIRNETLSLINRTTKAIIGSAKELTDEFNKVSRTVRDFSKDIANSNIYRGAGISAQNAAATLIGGKKSKSSSTTNDVQTSDSYINSAASNINGYSKNTSSIKAATNIIVQSPPTPSSSINADEVGKIEAAGQNKIIHKSNESANVNPIGKPIEIDADSLIKSQQNATISIDKIGGVLREWQELLSNSLDKNSIATRGLNKNLKKTGPMGRMFGAMSRWLGGGARVLGATGAEVAKSPLSSGGSGGVISDITEQLATAGLAAFATAIKNGASGRDKRFEGSITTVHENMLKIKETDPALMAKLINAKSDDEQASLIYEDAYNKLKDKKVNVAKLDEAANHKISGIERMDSDDFIKAVKTLSSENKDYKSLEGISDEDLKMYWDRIHSMRDQKRTRDTYTGLLNDNKDKESDPSISKEQIKSRTLDNGIHDKQFNDPGSNTDLEGRLSMLIGRAGAGFGDGKSVGVLHKDGSYTVYGENDEEIAGGSIHNKSDRMYVPPELLKAYNEAKTTDERERILKKINALFEERIAKENEIRKGLKTEDDVAQYEKEQAVEGGIREELTAGGNDAAKLSEAIINARRSLKELYDNESDAQIEERLRKLVHDTKGLEKVDTTAYKGKDNKKGIFGAIADATDKFIRNSKGEEDELTVHPDDEEGIITDPIVVQSGDAGKQANPNGAPVPPSQSPIAQTSAEALQRGSQETANAANVLSAETIATALKGTLSDLFASLGNVVVNNQTVNNTHNNYGGAVGLGPNGGDVWGTSR